MIQFVALIQQGNVLDQRVIAVSPDQEAILAQAEQAAAKLNAEPGESWTAVVLPVPAEQ